ncbi:MAG: dimethylmenaquinone methyltransferase [Pseudomonadota bacterium]
MTSTNPADQSALRAACKSLADCGAATVVDACADATMLDADWIVLLPQRTVAGPVLTVDCVAGDNLSIHAAIAELAPGEILVVAGGADSTIALLGDMIGTQLKARGAAGVLVDGPVRDIEALRALDLPVWARRIRPAGPVKKTFGAVGGDILVAGVYVRRGDWMVMDADGAVVLPATAVPGALESARKRQDGETEKRKRYAAGEISVDVLNLKALLAAQGHLPGKPG